MNLNIMDHPEHRPLKVGDQGHPPHMALNGTPRPDA